VQGFTLVELMIVVAIIAIIASMAVPNLLSARSNANESAAIATLRSITSAQSQLQTAGAVDANTNGAGEFGYFGELAGDIGVRDSSGSASANRVSPPVLSGNFAIVTSPPPFTGGVVIRSGYVFQMYLPSASGVGLPEADTGGVSATAPDAGRSEVLWCCYAWPTAYGSSGHRAFFVNQFGDVMSTRNVSQRYSSDRPPLHTAAFAKGAASGMASSVALNRSGDDDQIWIVVN
jgi:prepilin-type N-terminal cleavage/methylation domain-containing protein